MQVKHVDASGAELSLLWEVTPKLAKVLRAADEQVVTTFNLLPREHG